MKHKGKKKEAQYSEFYKETTYFLLLCSKEDADFFAVPDKERKMDDYVRLMVIAMALDFKGPMMRVLSEAEDRKRDKEVLDRLEQLKGDTATIAAWIDDFIDKIRNDDLKEIVLQHWNERREDFEKNGNLPL